MSEYFLGQIIMGGFNEVPRGFARCDGQVLPIHQNAALFALMGKAYGGDGSTTFALPAMQGRTPIGASKNYPFGAMGGVEGVVIGMEHMPAHRHAINATTAVGDFRDPNFAASTAEGVEALYSPASGPRVTLAHETISAVGSGGPPTQNMQPFCVLPFLIALTGVMPSPS